MYKFCANALKVILSLRGGVKV
ncbi:1-acyl-sn-glycerol-3-phosphate acyltransferase, partial [Bacillus spizizenii]|nr:1-acyl-sn-glycerol-3-phosphate acyltransferase [Bacillus spizizenii]